MKYFKFGQLNISELGFGLMRLPLKGPKTGDIDFDMAEKLIDLAIDHGVTYFDTAYGYHDGQSENFVGKYLSKYERSGYQLADKFPGYDLLMFGRFDEIFEEQLKKCKVDYFDFYLLHNLCELNLDSYLSSRFNIHDKIKKLKDEGKVKHIGVSNHGNPDTLRKFLKEYSDIVEFCQIQLNFMDWTFQNAKELVDILNEYEIPIFVMEPLRGGTVLNRASVEDAFNFVRKVEGVKLVLSGMSDMDQVIQNCDIFSKDNEMSTDRFNELIEKENARLESVNIPCTACNYCREYCSRKLNIPYLLELKNQFHSTENDFIAPMAMAALPVEKQPQSCIECHECEKVCPQKIDISNELKTFAKELDEIDEIVD